MLSLANRCRPLSTIFSKTGCGSAIEPLMTSSTSAVAVCRSRASCVSLNRRTFSIAITAWSAKVCSSDCSLASKAPSLRRVSAIAPMPTPWRMRGAMMTEQLSMPAISAMTRRLAGTSWPRATSG